jgi:hypothetical protein
VPFQPLEAGRASPGVRQRPALEVCKAGWLGRVLCPQESADT